MAASVEQFFQSYAQVLNRSVGKRGGLDAVRAHLADSFVVATPNGVRCGKDDEITETLRQMLDLWRAIGVQEIAIRVVSTTPIDETHVMAKVEFSGSVRRPEGDTLDLDTSPTYLLAKLEGAWKIFAFVGPDELALAREHGLIGG